MAAELTDLTHMINFLNSCCKSCALLRLWETLSNASTKFPTKEPKRQLLQQALINACSILVVAGPVQCRAEVVNPFPREVINSERLVKWTFVDGVAGFSASHD